MRDRRERPSCAIWLYEGDSGITVIHSVWNGARGLLRVLLGRIRIAMAKREIQMYEFPWFFLNWEI